MTNLSVMIGSCSLNRQHEGTGHHFANVGCSNLRYTNEGQSENVSETPKKKVDWRKQQNYNLQLF